MNKIITLQIDDLVYPGRGLARLDGCVVFIPGVLPGETVSARITRKKKNYAEAELVAVEVPSPDRISPICPLAGICPGCSYQHLDYEAEIRIKQAQFSDLLLRMGKVADLPLREPVPSPNHWGTGTRSPSTPGQNRRRIRDWAITALITGR